MRTTLTHDNHASQRPARVGKSLDPPNGVAIFFVDRGMIPPLHRVR